MHGPRICCTVASGHMRDYRSSIKRYFCSRCQGCHRLHVLARRRNKGWCAHSTPCWCKLRHGGYYIEQQCVQAEQTLACFMQKSCANFISPGGRRLSRAVKGIHAQRNFGLLRVPVAPPKAKTSGLGNLGLKLLAGSRALQGLAAGSKPCSLSCQFAAVWQKLGCLDPRYGFLILLMNRRGAISARIMLLR